MGTDWENGISWWFIFNQPAKLVWESLVTFMEEEVKDIAFAHPWLSPVSSWIHLNSFKARSLLAAKTSNPKTKPVWVNWDLQTSQLSKLQFLTQWTGPVYLNIGVVFWFMPIPNFKLSSYLLRTALLLYLNSISCKILNGLCFCKCHKHLLDTACGVKEGCNSSATFYHFLFCFYFVYCLSSHQEF